MNDRKPRRHFTAEQKVTAVKRHLIEGEAVSAICNELNLHPNQFYEWQKQLFNGAILAFSNENKRKIKSLEKEIVALNARISDKDSVIVELLEEHVKVKKSLGVR